MDKVDIVGICLKGLAILSTIVFLILWIRGYRRAKLDQKNSLPKEDYNVEFKTVKVQAKVIDLSCRVDMVGIKTPKSTEFFTAVFEINNGQIIRVDVPQEMYEGLEKGQKGELTLVENELYSFII